MKYRATSGGRLPCRTREYLERGAPEGSRNRELFEAACQFRDAMIEAAEAEQALIARALADGLSEHEARHTVHSAYSGAVRSPATGAAPSGSNGSNGKNGDHRDDHEPLPELPPPIDCGWRTLLETCFMPDEFVAIAVAGEGKDGAPVPKRGKTRTAAQWIRHIEARGGIEEVFPAKLGLYVRINPMRDGGARNQDVAAFRHVLVEFDCDAAGQPIPKEKQLAAIVTSGLPVSALIDSGNKSLHAWIRVDAPDEAQYRLRVDAVYEKFKHLNLDRQNRNPSRLSRCPDGFRQVGSELRRQRLLATGLGAASWIEWEARQIDDELEPMPVSSLSVYDISNDPNSVLGHRWLCRGGSLVIVGQSGIGKSSLCMQLMILWALGREAFGITPTRGKPLKSLLIQAENDIGDLAEMYQGVREGMGLTPEEERLLDSRIIIYRNTTHTGPGFVQMASKLIDRHKPDIVWVDPLLNFIGDDISDQKVISEFCCNQLNAISHRTGVIWALLHHTGKPSKDPKAGSHWTASDLAYSGLGSSALTNWAREMAVILRVPMPEGAPPTFQFSMTKRRKRAGLRDMDENATDTIFVRHSSGPGICWEQCAPPPKPSKGAASYSTGKRGRPSKFEEAAFRAVLAEFGGTLTRQNEQQVAERLAVSIRTLWNWHKLLQTNPS
jgi:RecA-family ATPase